MAPTETGRGWQSPGLGPRGGVTCRHLALGTGTLQCLGMVLGWKEQISARKTSLCLCAAAPRGGGAVRSWVFIFSPRPSLHHLPPSSTGPRFAQLLKSLSPAPPHTDAASAPSTPFCPSSVIGSRLGPVSSFSSSLWQKCSAWGPVGSPPRCPSGVLAHPLCPAMLAGFLFCGPSVRKLVKPSHPAPVGQSDIADPGRTHLSFLG